MFYQNHRPYNLTIKIILLEENNIQILFKTFWIVETWKSKLILYVPFTWHNSNIKRNLIRTI